MAPLDNFLTNSARMFAFDKVTREPENISRLIRIFFIFLFLSPMLKPNEFPHSLVEDIRREVHGHICHIEKPISIRPDLHKLFICTPNRDTLIFTMFCKNVVLNDSISKAADDVYMYFYAGNKSFSFSIISGIDYEVHTSPKWPADWRGKWPELYGKYNYNFAGILVVMLFVVIVDLYYIFRPFFANT